MCESVLLNSMKARGYSALGEREKVWVDLLPSLGFKSNDSSYQMFHRLMVLARVLIANDFDLLAQLRYAPAVATWEKQERLKDEERVFLEELCAAQRKR